MSGGRRKKYSGICLDSLCAQPVAALLNVGESTSSCSSAQKDRWQIGSLYILYVLVFFFGTVNIYIYKLYLFVYIYIYLLITFYTHTDYTYLH